MAGCKTWRGKLTWSFPFERVATLGERREKERGGGSHERSQKTKAQCSLWSRKRTITSRGHKRIRVTGTEADKEISAIRSV